MNLADVTREIRNIKGVADVHDLHIWSLGSDAAALSCHLVIEDMPTSESQLILNHVNNVLGETFHIHHTTIQFEHKRCAVADMCAGGARTDPAMARGLH
jgi:cobalt-zinc-cadmium efflux system protein